jgi:hypothetical protein
VVVIAESTFPNPHLVRPQVAKSRVLEMHNRAHAPQNPAVAAIAEDLLDASTVLVPTNMLELMAADSAVAASHLHPQPRSSPARRFGMVAMHAELTPGIANVAEHAAAIEVEPDGSLSPSRLSKPEAKELMKDVYVTLEGRKKRRVLSVAARVCAEWEVAWLAKKAREAAYKAKRVPSTPRMVTRQVRDRTGRVLK